MALSLEVDIKYGVLSNGTEEMEQKDSIPS
jgi:hypothetical protein